MQIHLDPVGGVAGDMFIAAVLHAFPDLEAGLLDAIRSVGIDPHLVCRFEPHRDHVLQGARFLVEFEHHHDRDHDHHDGNGHHHHHDHATWASIRELLARSPLGEDVKTHAVNIFTLLARAEARVHGIAEADVAFHEVGAADSIADIVGAAWLIAALGAERWSVSALPLGSGTVRTAHGPLPVPAPATALLLEGFRTVDDGIPGERVTPTGAAILRHLACTHEPFPGPRTLRGTGIGFGLRTFPGRSNCLRVLAFETTPTNANPSPPEVAVIEFETDDQSPEDLALGLDRLRAAPAVLDVLQTPAFGKKGRLVTSVRVLARPEALDVVVAACFRETATIGLRHHVVRRVELARRAESVEVEGQTVRVKTVERPGIGRTAKAEADDLAAVAADGGHAARAGLRTAAEGRALSAFNPKSS